MKIATRPLRNDYFKSAVPKVPIRRPGRRCSDGERFAPGWQQSLVLRALAEAELQIAPEQRDVWLGLTIGAVARAAGVPCVLSSRHLRKLASLGLVLILANRPWRLREEDHYSLTRLGKVAAEQLRAPVALWILRRGQAAASTAPAAASTDL